MELADGQAAQLQEQMNIEDLQQQAQEELIEQ